MVAYMLWKVVSRIIKARKLFFLWIYILIRICSGHTIEWLKLFITQFMKLKTNESKTKFMQRSSLLLLLFNLFDKRRNVFLSYLEITMFITPNKWFKTISEILRSRNEIGSLDMKYRIFAFLQAIAKVLKKVMNTHRTLTNDFTNTKQNPMQENKYKTYLQQHYRKI